MRPNAPCAIKATRTNGMPRARPLPGCMRFACKTACWMVGLIPPLKGLRLPCERVASWLARPTDQHDWAEMNKALHRCKAL
jgi:hypothetical protein